MAKSSGRQQASGPTAKAPAEYAAADPGRPSEGVGSIASFGARLVAFLIDGILADLIGIAINGGLHNDNKQTVSVLVAFLAIEFLFISFLGQTPGMRSVGIAVLRADGQGKQKPQWIFVRTILVAVVAPALVIDPTGRAMSDKAAGTVMLRTR